MATDTIGDGSVVVSTVEGFAAVTLEAGPTRFTVLPEVGLLGASLTHHDRAYLDLHGGPEAALGGHTTGLPLLAPWANRLPGSSYRVGSRTIDLTDVPLHRDANGLPIHGVLVGRPGWELAAVRSQRGSASMTARFDASSDELVMAAFPFPHEILVGFTITPGRLMVSTTMVATGRRSVPVSFGWHPYFRIPDSERSRIRLGMPARHRLVLDELGLPTGEEQAEPATIRRLGDTSFDEAYRLGRDRQLLLAAGRRRLAVVFDSRYPFAQVYAPAEADFIALEPMTARTGALGSGSTPMVDPGDRFTARFAVSLT